MNPNGLDIVGVGDAIVDVIASCDDSFVKRREIEKGSMRLISADEARELYAAIGKAHAVSGGSAANSMAGAAVLGLRTAFVGQIADDELGAIFAQGMSSFGVRFETRPVLRPQQTGFCLILVTPDGQRTMSTFPGASRKLTPKALNVEVFRSAAVTFLEGYLWDPEEPRAAMLEAARIAQMAKKSVAFTLSESLRIGNRREGVLGMIKGGLIDILFGNEHEMRHVAACDSLRGCIEALSMNVRTLVITRGADGALACENGELVAVPAVRADRIVDTTGAGDLFAAGFLAGRLRGLPMKRCLETGAIAASEIISHFGARPEADLKALAGL